MPRYIDVNRFELIKMTMAQPKSPVYFYVPHSEWPQQGVPEPPITRWDIPDLWPRGGKYNHTIQTYLRLKTNGFSCQLVDKIPDEGILIAHRDLLPKNIKLLDPKLLVVCMKAERKPHPYAQFHIVQNPVEESSLGSCWNAHYIPLWPQRGLIPRDSNRQDRFETVAYFGRTVNLAPELEDPNWSKQLRQLGLNWYHASEEHLWYDYSEVDVIIAVRSFDQRTYEAKPATKLFNAWHAGVPAISGNDSAFQAEFRSELDFIKVETVDDAIAALKRLRDDVNLRRAMVENGMQRAEETKPETLVQRWQSFITDIAMPAYERQRRESGVSHQVSFIRRCFDIQSQRIRNKAFQVS